MASTFGKSKFSKVELMEPETREREREREKERERKRERERYVDREIDRFVFTFEVKQ